MSSFVIAVDTQRDFMDSDGALSVSGADALAGPMRDWVAALDPAEIGGILFTFDTHDLEVYAGSAEAEQFPPHCVKGTAGWSNVLDVAAVPRAIPAWRLEKGVFDMWAEADIAIEDARDPAAEPIPREAFFERIRAKGIEDITVIGVAADYCVRWAIDGLVARGFRVTVSKDLTRGIARPIDQVLAEDFAGEAVALG